MMLQSVKLCADKLNSITTTAADPATATSVPVVTNPVTTLPAPVAIANANANGSVFNSTAGNNTNDNSGGGGVGVGGSNNNDKNSLMADNSSLSSSIHLQLQQYQGNFLDTATEPAPAAAPVRFHPYLCPTEKPATASTPATSAPFVAALFPAFLQNSVNSNVPIKAPSTPASQAATSGAGTAALQSVLLTLPAAAGATNVTAATVGATAAFINSKTSLGGNKSQSALHLSSEVTSDSAGTNAACADNAGDRFELVVAGSPPNNGGVDRLADADQSDTGGIDSDGWKGGAVRVDNDEFAKDQPDPDNIKMFVGQIPKSWDETQLHKLFEQYGRVHTLNVLRDKVTSVSRGCCFVTYYTRKAALKAQDALHNIKTLDGMHHPIQMKPADSENRNERKLFVGMLNKKYNEADVRQLFTGHGTIEECTVLRDQNGQSKGCAFVTFATKQNAIGAIKALHQSQTMEGCSAPLVVKFADTQKEKDQKKIHQLQASICGITALGGPATGALGSLTSAQSNGITPTAAATLVPAPIGASMRSNSSMSAALTAVSAPTPSTLGSASALVPSSTALTMSPNLLATAGSPLQSSPYLTTDAMNASAAQLQLFHQLQAFGLHPAQYLQGLNFPPDHSVATASLSVAAAGTNNTAASGLLAAPGISMQNLVALATLDSSHHPVSQHHAHHAHHQTHSHAHAHAQAQAQAHMQAQHAHAQHTAAAQTAPQSLNAAAHAHMAQLIAAQSAAVSAQPMNAQLTGTTTLWPSADSLTSAYTPTLNPLANGVAYAAASAPLTASSLQAAAAGVAGKQIEGPDGSNLFIYHLPQEFTDTDLASTFLPFGNVLSAKVFIDKQTNLSKCFGFVSYDNPHSANAAIQAMHGCQIGNKRLKVQLKRSKDAAKPY